MNRLFSILLLLIVAGSAAVYADTANNPSAVVATIELSGSTVTYAGKISDQNVERFLDTVNGKEVSVLIISSSGGEINAAMEMGEWLFDNHVDIVVEGMCMSSCANYVFTAGRRKTINRNSIVAWHGSILQEFGMSDEDVRAAVLESFSKLPESEQKKTDVEVLISRSIRQMQEYRLNSMAAQGQFFRKIGVDEYLCRVGNEKYGAADFFALSVKDMARFGLFEVHAPEDYEKTDLTPFRQTGKSVEFVDLR